MIGPLLLRGGVKKNAENKMYVRVAHETEPVLNTFIQFVASENGLPWFKKYLNLCALFHKLPFTLSRRLFRNGPQANYHRFLQLNCVVAY